MMGRANAENSVPVEPFRDRFLELNRRGVSTTEICRRMGWMEMREVSQSSRLRRTLGIQSDAHGSKRQRIMIEAAEELCKALDMDPYEAGL